MALKTYLVRVEGVSSYVAEVQAKSAKEALAHAQRERNVLDWYDEDEGNFEAVPDTYEIIQPDDTVLNFD